MFQRFKPTTVNVGSNYFAIVQDYHLGKCLSTLADIEQHFYFALW